MGCICLPKKPVTSENEDLEQEARIALLQHFSSKSSNQVTSALTIALIFFAFATAIEPVKSLFGNWSIPFLWSFSSKILCEVFFAIILSALVALAFRTFTRLLFWGELSGLILDCEAASEKRILEVWSDVKREQKNMKENIEEKMKVLGYSGNHLPGSIPTHIPRLTQGCSDLYSSKFLTKSKKPYSRKRFSYRYARFKETYIVFGASVAISVALVFLLNYA
jgi:hypothetical protein